MRASAHQTTFKSPLAGDGEPDRSSRGSRAFIARDSIGLRAPGFQVEQETLDLNDLLRTWSAPTLKIFVGRQAIMLTNSEIGRTDFRICSGE